MMVVTLKMSKEVFSSPPTTFDVSIYGEGKHISNTIDNYRLRIFYKGMNRNRTFITDDFAQQLIDSLPYTPVKGIFNKDTLDYEDHGENNSDGKIYGIVPEKPNFSWEEHLDGDGVTRSYACCDVYLFTALYPEASLIPGKSQSMEIYRKSLQGQWLISEEDGKPYYRFEKGEFIGLQALGDDVEPCFEGAAFFELLKDFEQHLNKEDTKSKEGKEVMDKSLFRLSDNEKADILFDLANPNFNEEGNWQLDSGCIIDVYDDYALAANKTGFTRLYYSKDGDNVTLNEKVPVKIVDVTEAEYAALETMKTMNSSFEGFMTEYNTAVEAAKKFEEEKVAFEAQITELNNKIAVFESAATNTDNSTDSNADSEPAVNNNVEFNNRVSELENENVKLNSQLTDITNENKSLMEFKKNVENKEKESILSKYEEFLTDEAIASFKDNIANYTVEDFKKEVCTEVLENRDLSSNHEDAPSVFFKANNAADKLPQNGALALINKYKNGGNK